MQMKGREKSMSVKNCVIVGMGLLGAMHADRLNQYKNTKVVAVCDMVAEKACDWAEKNGTDWYDSVDKMLAGHKPDLMVVATQDPYHTEPLLAACKNKVPYVICEKPLTTSLEDALKVKKAAEESGTAIKVLFPNRLFPLDQTVRLLLTEGFVGKPEYGEMRMDDNISVPLRLWGKDSKKYASISTPAYFLLSHAVDLLYFYLTPHRVKKVYAVGANSTIGSNPDYIDGYLTFDDGVIIRLKTEWTKRMGFIAENYVQCTASKGGFTYNKGDGFRKKTGLQVFIDGPRKNAERALALLKENNITAELVTFEDPIESYALELDPSMEGNNFDWGLASSLYADSFDGPEPELSPFTDLEGGIEQVRVVDALLRSSREGREILL